MSFLLPDEDDDNHFANAVSPFATFTSPPPPPAATAPAASEGGYGSPLPTPDEDAVGHTPGPYVQALDGRAEEEQGGDSPGGGGSSSAFAAATFDESDDRSSLAQPSLAPTAVTAGSPDAFTSGFQSSPSVQTAFNIYRPASPPPLPSGIGGGEGGEPLDSSSSFSPTGASVLPAGASGSPAGSSPAGKGPLGAAGSGKRPEVEASLADLLGESEEVRLKGAFRKATTSSATAAAAAGRGPSLSKPPTTTTAAAADDDDDPFGALVRKRKGKKPASATGTAASVSPTTTQAAEQKPSSAGGAPLGEAVVGPPLQTIPDAANDNDGPSTPTASATPAQTVAAAPQLAAPTSSPKTAEDVALPPSGPPTSAGTPRASTPTVAVHTNGRGELPTSAPATATATKEADGHGSSSMLQSRTGLTSSTASTSSSSAPSSRPSSPSQIDTASSEASAVSGRGAVDDDGEADRFGPGRVERSFSELTLDPARAAQLGLGPSNVPSASSSVVMGGSSGAVGWTTAPPLGGDGGGGWGGEEERLHFSAAAGGGVGIGQSEPNAASDDVVDDDEQTGLAAATAAAAERAEAPAPVDKDFALAAKRADRLFVVHISDPTKVGLGATAHIVYTVTTTLRVPTEYGTQSKVVAVLRRFSDFLWLFGALVEGNRGVIVPPVPDKQSFGRFGDEFIAHRRAQLQTFLSKTADHAVLQLDPVLTAFLTADNWSGEMKHWTRSRALDGHSTPSGGGGTGASEKGYLASLTSGLTGPKFVERDDWFDDRRAALDTLEGQLKALVKSVDLVSKQRLDLAGAIHDFALSISSLAQCDLSRPMALALERFSDVLRRAKEKEEGNGRGDVGGFMATADEYIRLIGSVRNAFSSRIKSYLAWQNLELDARRQRTTLDKARRQGKLAAERVGQEIALVGDAERRAKEAGSEFESVTRLIKNEYGRFEDERVEDFKAMLETYVEGMIHRQKTLISAYEDYHASLVRLVQQSQPQPPSPVQPKLASPSRPTASASDTGADSPERSRVAPGIGGTMGGSNPFAEEDGERQAGGGDGGSLASLPVENAWA